MGWGTTEDTAQCIDIRRGCVKDAGKQIIALFAMWNREHYANASIETSIAASAARTARNVHGILCMGPVFFLSLDFPARRDTNPARQ